MNLPGQPSLVTPSGERSSTSQHLFSDSARQKLYVSYQSRELQKSLHSIAPNKAPVDASGSDAKVIVVIDKDPYDLNLIDQCLQDGKDTPFTFLSSTEGETIKRMISSSNPDLIVADWNTLSGILSSSAGSGSLPDIYDIPVLLLTEDNAVASDAFVVPFGEGMMECIQKPVDKVEMRAKVNMLLKLKSYLRRIKVESQAATEDLDRRHRELHFELILHSGSVKERFLEEINQLDTHLNTEGRSKLRSLVRQFRWAIDDEAQVSFERTFDSLNKILYKKLEHICPRITKNEKRLCAFLMRDHSGSDIAKTIGKNPNSINVAFARLRTKLNMATNKDLKEFLVGLQAAVDLPA